MARHQRRVAREELGLMDTGQVEDTSFAVKTNYQRIIRLKRCIIKYEDQHKSRTTEFTSRKSVKVESSRCYPGEVRSDRFGKPSGVVDQADSAEDWTGRSQVKMSEK